MTFPIPELTTLFMLVFARVGILVMLMPGIGERMLPARFRLSIALLLTLVILPIAQPSFPTGLAPAAIVGILIGEIAIGLVLGLATRAVMSALQVAGNLVASQVGLSYAMTVDPTAGSQEAVIGNFLTLLGVTLIFAADLHHLAIGAIRDSYAMLPPATMPSTGDAAQLAIGAVGRGFALGVKIAAPFIAFALLFNLGLGILSRLMPQFQVFFVAMPLSVLIGMLILLATLGLMMSVFLTDLGRFLQELGRTLMAEGGDQEDKTEDPTAHRLEEAHKKGDVAKSQEVAIFLGLGALTLALMTMPAFGSLSHLAVDLRGFLANAHLVPRDGAGMLAAGVRGLVAGLEFLAVPVGAIMIAALAGGLIQHRPVFSTESMMPKFSRLSPMAGFKRMFGGQAVVQFVKGLAKIGIVGTLACWLLWRERDRFEGLVGQEPIGLLGFSTTLALKLLGAILAAHAILTIGDVVYQRFAWMKRQRMSREEIKQEMKEQDGNPEVKAKLRQIRMERVRKRMMAAVPEATVIITNPTHFAVALKYEAGMQAPLCVAKGIDHLALRIRAVATEHGVTIIENPPLARALHATVEIDAEIPVEHYKAVAEVIGFVLRLKRRAS